MGTASEVLTNSFSVPVAPPVYDIPMIPRNDLSWEKWTPSLVSCKVPELTIGKDSQTVFYTESKDEAVRLAVDGGLPLAEVGPRLSVNP